MVCQSRKPQSGCSPSGHRRKTRTTGTLLWSTATAASASRSDIGLEGVLPDGKVGAILDAYVMPKFKSGEFDEGVLAGVDALLGAARNEPVELPSQRSESYDNGSPGVGTVLIELLSASPIGLSSIFGFRKWRRRRRRRCPACQTRMVCLTEADDDALLEKGQQAEERVGSVDYDVWKCGACSHHFTLRYPKWVSNFAKCPQCHNHTKSSTQTVIEHASTTSSGRARVVEACAFCRLRRSTRRPSRASRRAPLRRAVRRAAVPAVSAAAARAVAAPAGDTRCPREVQRRLLETPSQPPHG